tara:strand:- start:161 stop:1153 length:993 start_codon:yes stop_codon:yes gene_type:complete
MQDFKTVFPWFESKNKLLRESYSHHAYIFEGMRGIGKKIFTLEISKGLLCSSLPNSAFCNHCQSCHFFDEENHPDFYLIELQNGKKQISIDQIRSLQEPLYESAFLGANKVFVINPVDMMTREAFDAILKNLEEPPANNFFLLVSHRYHSLPQTIKSRCSQLSLNQPDNEEIKSWLNKKFDNNSNIDLAVLFSKGKPLVAAEMLNFDVKNLRINFIKEISELIKTGDNLIGISKSWSKDLDEMLLKVEWMSDLLMDCLRLKFLSGNTFIYKDTEAISSYLADKIDCDDFFYLLDKTNTFWSLFNSSTNLRADYQLQSLFVNWTEKAGLAR